MKKDEKNLLILIGIGILLVWLNKGMSLYDIIPPTTYTLNAVNLGDTYVTDYSTYDDTNYGNENVLYVLDQSAYEKRTYILWNISVLPTNAIITNAQLGLYKYQALASGLILAYGTSAEWTENSLTWNNQPSSGTSQSSTSVLSTGWYYWDVTNAAESALSQGKMSVRIVDVNNIGQNFVFCSRHATGSPTACDLTKRPTLVITYFIQANPPTPSEIDIFAIFNQLWNMLWSSLKALFGWA